MADSRRKPKPSPSGLTHIDRAGRPRMVDVSAKADTAREAVAKGSVYMATETLELAISGRAAKGDVLTTAQLAGIMAAKRTHELIPLCHPLPLTGIAVTLEPDEARGAVDITATVRTTAKTGVEMEALTAVSVAALTVYDMLKAAQRDIRIGDIRLARKSGGRSGEIELEERQPVTEDELILQTDERIRDCHSEVARFYERDASYRAYDLVTVREDDVLREDEVRLANRLNARMGSAIVTDVMRRAGRIGDALAGIPPGTPLGDGPGREVEQRLLELFRSAVGPHVGISRASKFLHKKRPNVVPILDQFVMRYVERVARMQKIRLPGEQPERAVMAIRLLRKDLVRNVDLLTRIGSEFRVSPVRTLDILIWLSEYTPVWSR